METTAIITPEILNLLPQNETWEVGEEITVEYAVEWRGGMHRHDGDAVVTEVVYHPFNGCTEVDLTALVDPEIDGEVAMEALQDHIEGYGDYCYENRKDQF